MFSFYCIFSYIEIKDFIAHTVIRTYIDDLDTRDKKAIVYIKLHRLNENLFEYRIILQL